MKTKKSSLKNLKQKTIFKRKPAKRKLTRQFNAETASRAIGRIEKGSEIFGFTKGQFSKIDVIEHCLEQTGPADVFICTWSASSGDIRRAHNFLSHSKIRSLKFIVDFSFKARKPAFLKELVDTFGVDCVRMTVVHAKFVLIRNENWNIVIRTSMNLNYNPRFENFEISESEDFADFIQNIVEEIWENSDAAESITKGTGVIQRRFKQMHLIDGFDKDNVLDLVPGEL
jgi:hypothetical protein